MAIVLTMALSSDMAARAELPRDVKASVEAAAIGAKLKVELNGGEVIRGRLSAVDRDSFTIVTGHGKGTPHVIRYLDAGDVKVTARTHTPIAAWIAAGAIVTVVVIVVAVFAIERRNEGG